MVSRRFPMPQFMEQGSKGPVVNAVLSFLDPLATKAQAGPTGIILDGDYGEVGAGVMKKWQSAHGISADGGCGPETRQTMAAGGFDLDAFVHSTVFTDDDITAFVQPDGTTLYWAPYVAADTDSAAARTHFSLSRRSN